MSLVVFTTPRRCVLSDSVPVEGKHTGGIDDVFLWFNKIKAVK